MICFTPTFFSTFFAPIPERSRMAGDPKAPAEITTSRRAVAEETSSLVLGWKCLLGTYSTPVARPLLSA